MIHDKISDACLLAEQYFRTQILIITINAFSNILLSTFRILAVATQTSHPIKDINLMEVIEFYSIHIALSVIILFGILSVCVSAIKEVSSSARETWH